MRKSVNIRWYQRLPHVEIILMPVRYSHLRTSSSISLGKGDISGNIVSFSIFYTY
jgi:hypothetical protein